MKKLLNSLVLAFLLAVLLVPSAGAANALPAPLGDDIIVVAPRTIEEGEEINGDVHVTAGLLTVENGGVIDGNLYIYGGSATLYGEVDGDIVVFGGSLSLEETAYVGGEVVSLGGSIDRAAGAVVEGGITTTGDFGNIPVPPVAPDPPSFDFDGPNWRVDTPANWGVLDVVGNSVRILLTSFAFGALALVLYLFIPRQIDTIGDTVSQRFLPSFGAGILTGLIWLLVTVPLAIVLALIAITIILSPISIVGLFLLALVGFLVYLMSLMGWLSIGSLVGRRLMAESGGSLSPAVAAGIGTFTISILIFFLQQLPFVGWLFGLLYSLLLAVGLGAVILTRFGGQPTTPRDAPPRPATPAPPAPQIDAPSNG